MLYSAYLVLCMIGPLGSGGCAPAAAPIDFPTQVKCEKYIAREVGYYKAGLGLEAMRPYLPTMRQGKLKIKAGCNIKLVDEWLGVDMPEMQNDLFSNDGEDLSDGD